MKTEDKVALCNNLNMNFDEASELFCEESLQSMQMAKISGGAEWWDNFCDWVRRVFKNVKVEVNWEYNSKTGHKITVGAKFSILTTERPTGDGVSYYAGGLNLSNYGCSMSFVETSRGVFNLSGGSYSGEIEPPTLA